MEFDPEFEENISRQLSGPTKRKAIRFGIGFFGLIALVVLFLASVVPYTDYLWFVHDVERPQVWEIVYITRGILFSFAFVFAVVLLYWTLSVATKLALVYIRRPETTGELLGSNALGWVQSRSGTLVKAVSVILAAFYALSFSSEWNTYLGAANAASFNKTDPTFGLDLSFFVFKLPWYLALSNFVTTLLVIATLATIGVYAGLQTLASLAKVELGQAQVRQHICLLSGLTVLMFGFGLWMRRYNVGLSDTPQFTGAGLAGMQQMLGQSISAVLFMILGIGTILSGFTNGTYRAPITAGVVVTVFWFLSSIVYPSAVQAFKVEPDKLQVEGPFAKQAIEMTRYAYGLDKIDVRNTTVTDNPTPGDMVKADQTIRNMRLWDPDVLRQSFDGIQGLKPYYTFHDVDIDRYRVGGEDRLMMLSPRDIKIEGLSPSSRTWVNERLQYTHGYGVTMASVNAATSIGQPNYVVKDIPPSSPDWLPFEQPRIYFSDFRDVTRSPIDQYAIVNTKVPEFDYPAQDSYQTYRWTGKGGVPVGGLFSKLAFSIRLGDGNLLISSNITKDSRLLLRRNVLDRASLVYRFLRFDQDPYIVLANGKLTWILDAYTVSDRIPYSARIQGGQQALNYIRNSVKVTIDAYSGDMNAYEMSDAEPILQTYKKVYPGLIKPRSELPKSLERHLRYPEDMFMVQAFQLTQYHVLDPTAFLNNEDAWDMPVERGPSGDSEPMRAYYVQMRVPGEARDGFLLILPFTPRQKINMSGWLAAHCDPEDYGKVALVKYPRGSNMPGPAQMEAIFNQDKTIADINRQLNNDQSRIVPGNLLVVPIGNSVLYVKPLFLQSRSSGIQAIPELKKVILALKGNVVVGDTYAEALQLLFGDRSASSATPTQPETPPKPGTDATVGDPDSAAALKLFQEAEAALRSGDFATYGEVQKRLGGLLKRMAERASQESQR